MASKVETLSEYLRQQKPNNGEEEDEPLNSMNHRQIEEVADINKSSQWLEKAGLRDSTEALIMAAQEQALSTRSIEAGVYHSRQDPRCRLCKDAPETVQHIVAGCKMQSGTVYKEPSVWHSVQEHLH
ncbi:zinc-binding domain-containing protein%2C partial [Scomber scombrus]|uniref:Zinc-binding domain-containing protein, partial n=1 Tax=Scomber scombrus TaxID=13677 RepID=A0AAV1Q3S6_SCOSC